VWIDRARGSSADGDDDVADLSDDDGDGREAPRSMPHQVISASRQNVRHRVRRCCGIALSILRYEKSRRPKQGERDPDSWIR